MPAHTENSVKNSSTTALNDGQTFTGTAEQITQWPSLFVFVNTDQNGVLYVEFSTNGTNWETSLSFQYNTGRINPPHIFEIGGRFVRIRFENNSGSNQTYFRLITQYGTFSKLTSPVNGTLAENYDATVVRPTDYHYEVAMSKRQGRTTVNKWGYNSDVDTGGEEVIARQGGSVAIMTTADTLDVVSDSANDAAAGTGAQTILISGIDANALSQTEIVTLNGVTPVTTVNTWLGVNRVVVLSSGSLQANAGNITLDDTLNAVGIQAYVPSGESVTHQAIFHTQVNHNLLADWLWINCRKLSGGGTPPRVTIRGWSYSRVTDTFYQVFRVDIDESVENTKELKPSQPFVIGGREVLYFTAETDTNNTVVNCRFSGIEERVN